MPDEVKSEVGRNPERENGAFTERVSDDEIVAAWLEEPSTRKLARRFGYAERSMRKRLATLREAGLLPDAAADVDRQGKIAQLGASVPVTLNGGKLSELSTNLWGAAAKDADGNLVTQGLDGIRATYKFAAETPSFPLIQPANPSTFAYYSSGPTILRKVRTAVILSDAQIGFLRKNDELVPTHDPHAMDVALQIVKDLAPNELDWIGDWSDLPMFSRWPKTPEQVNTTQASIQAGHDYAGEFISAAGPQCTRRRFVSGNHDERFALWAREHNLEAMNLKRASDTSGWPVFSTPFLLRFDELGIEMTAPYPAGAVWLADGLMLTHAPPKKLEVAASVIHGHLHKLTRTTWAQTNEQGRVTYFLWDIGCLCKIDGTVPSDRARTDWAQGLGYVEMIDGKIPKHNVEQVHIENGYALYRGGEYSSSLRIPTTEAA